MWPRNVWAAAVNFYQHQPCCSRHGQIVDAATQPRPDFATFKQRCIVDRTRRQRGQVFCANKIPPLRHPCAVHHVPRVGWRGSSERASRFSIADAHTFRYSTGLKCSKSLGTCLTHKDVQGAVGRRAQNFACGRHCSETSHKYIECTRWNCDSPFQQRPKRMWQYPAVYACKIAVVKRSWRRTIDELVHPLRFCQHSRKRVTCLAFSPPVKEEKRTSRETRAFGVLFTDACEKLSSTAALKFVAVAEIRL